MQFEHFLKIHSQSKMVMIYKMYNNFFLFHLQSQCLYKKQPGKHHTGRRNHQIKANCVALSWADHYFPSGMKKATLAKSDFTGQDILTGTAFPSSLLQPVLDSCNSRPSLSLFCQSPLPETNPQFHFGA